jgi:tRNA/rRNA methyltransferase
MNLGQAVAVCLYELATRAFEVEPEVAAKPQTAERLEAAVEERAPTVRSGHLDLLAGLIEQVMRAAGYSPRAMQAANRRDLRLLLRRIALSERDARRILGLFRRILWRLKRATHEQL